jgi:hypothetical protein
VTTRVELRLELEDDDHVVGTLRGDDGVEVGFVGWIGLLALLQRAVGPGERAASAAG